MSKDQTNPPSWIRPLAWCAAATLILLPLVVLKLADPSSWRIEDLPFAFVFIAAVGLAFELALRCPANWTYRAGAAVAILACSLLIWGNLAVGFAGSEDNQVNVVFFAIPALALASSLAAGFRPSGLAVAMAIAAVSQIAAGVIAFYYGYFTGPLTFAFTGFWLASSLMFLRSSQEIASPVARNCR